MTALARASYPEPYKWRCDIMQVPEWNMKLHLFKLLKHLLHDLNCTYIYDHIYIYSG